MAIRRFGTFVNDVILPPLTSEDCPGCEDERAQNKQGCVCETHDSKVPDLWTRLEEEFCVLIHLLTQLATNWLLTNHSRYEKRNDIERCCSGRGPDASFVLE